MMINTLPQPRVIYDKRRRDNESFRILKKEFEELVRTPRILLQSEMESKIHEEECHTDHKRCVILGVDSLDPEVFREYGISGDIFLIDERGRFYVQKDVYFYSKIPECLHLRDPSDERTYSEISFGELAFRISEVPHDSWASAERVIKRISEIREGRGYLR